MATAYVGYEPAGDGANAVLAELAHGRRIDVIAMLSFNLLDSSCLRVKLWRSMCLERNGILPGPDSHMDL